MFIKIFNKIEFFFFIKRRTSKQLLARRIGQEKGNLGGLNRTVSVFQKREYPTAQAVDRTKEQVG